jgi:hypothetical protein
VVLCGIVAASAAASTDPNISGASAVSLDEKGGANKLEDSPTKK